MQNIEFKAELRDPELARLKCRALDAQLHGTIEQTDTYYRQADGRLKKRESPGEPTEWIYYDRPDRVTPRMSHYMRYSDEQARTRWGVLPLREWIVVRKVREVWLLDQTRIHLDEVRDLGSFIEFEAMVSREQPLDQCRRMVARLREEFQPALGEAIASGYADLLDSATASPASDEG